MYQVKDLTITHKKDLTTLVEGLSLALAPGDRAAIIGEEGNGKSTVLKLLYDPALVEPYAEWTGEIVDKGLRRGYLAQELSPEELARPVWEFCQGSSVFDGADPGALDRAARQVGLSPELFWDGRPMSTLSGGERVKLRLALLLLDGPDLLLLDEPSNDLDLRTLDWLEEFLLGCEVPVLYISHDERLLERTANVVVHLERLRRRTLPRCTVARVGYERYVEERAARFARQERNAAQERRAYEAKMERYRQIRDKVDHRQATITRQDPHGGRMLKKKMHAVQSLGRRFEREREDMTAMPEWEEAILAAFDEGKSAFPAGKTALRLDLPELRAGERVLSRNIRLWVTGPEKIGIVGAQRGGQVHPAEAGGPGAAAQNGPPGGLHAPGLRRAAAGGQDPGGDAGPLGPQGRRDPRPHPAGEHEVQGGGDGAPRGGAVRGPAGQAAVSGYGAERGQRADAGRAHPELLPPVRPQHTAGIGRSPRCDRQRVP